MDSLFLWSAKLYFVLMLILLMCDVILAERIFIHLMPTFISSGQYPEEGNAYEI